MRSDNHYEVIIIGSGAGGGNIELYDAGLIRLRVGDQIAARRGA